MVEVVEVKQKVGASKLVVIMLLLSAFFFSCNVSYQSVYLTLDIVISLHDNLWLQHAIVALSVACLGASLGDWVINLHQNIRLFSCWCVLLDV